MNPIIFLDFDGVLNSSAWQGRRHESRLHPDLKNRPYLIQIDPAAIGLLNQLIDRTGADVVVTSSWRGHSVGFLQTLLRQRGFLGRVVGITPRINNAARSAEIKAWCEPHDWFPCVAIDDDKIGGGLEFVQTNHEVGISQQDVDLACQILNSGADR